MGGWAMAAATVANAASSAYGSNKASKAQKQAADRASAISQAQYVQSRSDLAPYMSAGYAALAEQRRQLGLGDYQPGDVSGTGDVQLVPINGQKAAGGSQVYADKYTGDAYLIARSGANAGQYVPLGHKVQGYTPEARPQAAPGTSSASGGRYGAFEATPGYQFRLDQGNQAIDRNNAARGRSYSGASLREAARYASGQASQEYDNYYQRLAGLSGAGQNATNTGTSVAINNSSNQGTSALLAGASRASGIANTYDIYGRAINDIGGAFGEYYRNKAGGSGSNSAAASGAPMGYYT